ncbi:MAG: PIN/TRAM domain-containing protein [Planctomycetaceae bacterium]|nr:MAG: PIN/TRAM domain-containing protein [Planctomycetaceae bacterium]
MALIILRCIFLICAGGASAIINASLPDGTASHMPWTVFLVVMGLAMAAIVADIFVPRKQIDTISAVYFGLLVGVLLTYIFSIASAPLLDRTGNAGSIVLVTAVIACYLCISVLIQTKDDFRFLIPYVEFVRDTKGFRPLILDTSVIIDGRIEDLLATQVFDNQLILPRFALAELQAIADSNDKLRRQRGRRGLDILNRLRADPKIDLQIFDRDLPEFTGHPVDMKLVLLAKHLEGKVVTGDFNLNQVAQIHNVPVINLNEISNALKPRLLPGESFPIKIIKPGEGPAQGIGYLDDGTMVVVEGARQSIGRDLHAIVTSIHQTNAGRMIFAKYEP